jgi:argininosuccinate synthase
MKKIVLAYSGGLDTSVMLKWLKLKYDCQITAVNVNLENKDLSHLKEKALSTGADNCYIIDAQNEFLHNYAFFSLQASALYESVYPLATAIARPLIAKKLVEIAHLENADIIAHGCTGKGNDQLRFDYSIKALDPKIEVIAPIRHWEFKSREDEIDFAEKHNIPLTITKEKPYSIDSNLWGMAIECGELENLFLPAPEDAFFITKNPLATENTEEIIEIEFQQGIPVLLNGIEYSSEQLVEHLNDIGANHGIGRIDMVENRVVGIKSREIYEAPAASILHKAHYELEKLVLDKETFREKEQIAHKVANLIYDGKWFSPLFDCLKSFVLKSQENVTGKIKLALCHGNMRIISRESPYNLYDYTLATYGSEDLFDHKASEGYSKLYCLEQSLVTMKKPVKELAK